MPYASESLYFDFGKHCFCCYSVINQYANLSKISIIMLFPIIVFMKKRLF